MASPKHPQSGTGSHIASINVRKVKKIMSGNNTQEDLLIEALNINEMPRINSSAQRDIDRNNASGMAHSVPYAMK